MFLSENYRDEVIQLMHENLGIDKVSLESIYSYFKMNSENMNVQLDNKLNSFLIQDLNPKFHELASNKCSYGIDLPVWFSCNDKTKKKLLILAMDPMRGADDRTTADINSPFTIHQGHHNNYFPAINKLSETFDVYVTDVFKLFYREPSNKKRVSNTIPCFTKLPIHSHIIQCEIDLFKPDLILCLGKHPLIGLHKLGKLDAKPRTTIGKISPYLFSRNEGSAIPTFAIPHASGVATKWAMTFLRNNNWQGPYNSKTYISDALEIIMNELRISK